jgi:hypothetical protein
VLVAALVFSIAGVVVGAYVGVGSLSSAAGTVSIGSFALDTVSYVPHILLLFGVLADMFTLQGVWSIPSLVGVLSIFANYLFEYFWKGLDSLVESAKTTIRKPMDQEPPPPPAGGKRMKGGKLFESYTGCSVQGLEGWNSAYAPQTLVITATIFSSYCLDLVRNRGWVNSIGVLLSFVLAYLAQVGVISYNTSSVGSVQNKPGMNGSMQKDTAAQPANGGQKMVAANQNLKEQPGASQEPAGTTMPKKEGFADLTSMEGPANFASVSAPAGCYPRDQLTPSELLPADQRTIYAEQNPMGPGSLKGKNFLSAGALIGVNTVGQSLRNANLQIRSEPPNPQVPVSIFLQSTIQPDISHRPLEIGS